MSHNQKMSRQAKRLLRSYGYMRPQYTEVTEFTSLLGTKNNNESKFSLATEAYQNMEQGLSTSHMMLYLEHQEREGKFKSSENYLEL